MKKRYGEEPIIALAVVDKEALEAALRKSTGPTGQAPGGKRDADPYNRLQAPRLLACGFAAQHAALRREVL